jgi:membrane protease subunit HflC
MRGRFAVWAIIAIGVLIVLANTLFVVDQRQQAIVLRLGEPVRVVHAPGQGGSGLNL